MKYEEKKPKKRINRGGRLPDDIICEILVRLPTDSVLKCRAVCKLWNSLVNTRAFILTHLNYRLLIQSNNNKNIKDHLLLSCSLCNIKEGMGMGAEFFLLDCDSFGDEYTKRRVIPASDFIAAASSIHGRKKGFKRSRFLVPEGTCNGLICLVGLSSSKTRQRVSLVVLWNPCLRKFLVLPSPTSSPYKFAFPVCELGYDPLTNDFKLVQMVVPEHRDGQTPYTFQVFSLNAWSWKNLNPPPDFRPFFYDPKSVEVNGALHWVCGKPYTLIDECTVIITFNLSTELFGKIKIPEALRKDSSPDSFFYNLKYRESFGLLCTSRARPDRFVYDMWVMKEFGVEESWTKLVAIRMPDSLRFSPEQPKYFRKSGRAILGTSNGVVSTDPEGKQVKIIVDDRLDIWCIQPFVESLVLLDRSDALSY